MGRIQRGEGRKALKTGLAGQVSQRGAMQVAGCGAVGGVEIRVGIEPEHKERAVLGLCLAGLAQNGAKRKAVIATHENRKRIGRGGFGQRFGPANGFGKVVDMGVAVGQGGAGCGHDIADISHLMAKLAQYFRQPGHAVGIRPHLATGLHHAGGYWCANKGELGGFHAHPDLF